MSRVLDPSSPLSVEANVQGGLNITGLSEEANQLNGDSENDLILTAPPEAGSGGIVSSLGDVVDGWDGDDTVAGYGGDDSVLGGTGNDLLFGNQGDDSVKGEDGADTIFAGQGSDSISGGSGQDVLRGDDGNDSVAGDSGSDRLFGNRGQDSLDGGAGDDTVLGGQGRDTVSGGDGNDLIAGDRGADSLTGGAGNDTFHFASYGKPENTAAAIGGDTLTDFTSGEDKIALDRAVYSELGDTLEAAEFETTTAVNGESTAKLIYNEATGELIYNPTTSAGDEMTIATLENRPNLSLGDLEIF